MVLQIVLQATVARQAQVGVAPQAAGSGEHPVKRMAVPKPPPVMFPQYCVEGLQSAGPTPKLIRTQVLEYVLPSQPHTGATFAGQGSGSKQ